MTYVAKRLGFSLLTLLGVTFASFLLVHLAPGDPARVELGARASEATVQALRHTQGLDKPFFTQYWNFLHGCLQGKFGTSIEYKTSVGSLISSRVLPTVLVITFGLVFSLILAWPLAVFAALNRGRRLDQLTRATGIFLFTMPAFWIGLLFSYGIGLKAHLLPTSGYGTGVWGVSRSLVLPSLTLALTAAPLFLRTLRASVIQTLDSGFVEAARARGLSEGRVITRHVLRYSAIPTITVVGLTIGFLVSGSVIIETVFNLPGLGVLFVDAVGARDFPVIQALTVLFATAVVLVNIVTDLAYAWADPRVRL